MMFRKSEPKRERKGDLMIEKAGKLTSKKLCFKKLTAAPVFGCINWILQQYA